MLGYASYVAKEVKEGCKDNLNGLWQLIRHPVTSLSDLGQVIRHPVSTAQNLSKFAWSHPWRLATNVGFSILQGRIISCANVNHPIVNRFASATTSPINAFPDPSSQIVRATLQNNTINGPCNNKYTPSYDSKQKANSNAADTEPQVRHPSSTSNRM